jgi:hypothetical protein
LIFGGFGFVSGIRFGCLGRRVERGVIRAKGEPTEGERVGTREVGS